MAAFDIRSWEQTTGGVYLPAPSLSPRPTALSEAVKVIMDKAEEYEHLKGYYEGDHDLKFATRKFATAFGSLFKEFADNLCPAVVDAVADRLKIVEFKVEEGLGGLADQAMAIWKANRMDRRAGQVHLEALRSGDAYVIVWPDPAGLPTIYPQRAAQMTVQYDPEQPGLVQQATKVWVSDDRLRATMYYPDRIEKWVSTIKVDALTGLGWKQEHFEPFRAPLERWPLPNPYNQVPVFHFANNADIGEFGISELRNVIPIQDALNKSIMDMLVAMEYLSVQQRWITGIEIDYDEEGRPKPPFRPGAENIWMVEDKDAKMGEFAAMDPSKLLAISEAFRVECARVSRTPLHYLGLEGGGAWPSGEAQRTAETPFVSKILDRHVSFGNTWEDALVFALLIAGVRTPSRLSTTWKNPVSRGEKEHLEALKIKSSLGVDDETIFTEMGYDGETVRRMAAAAEKSRKDAEARFEEDEPGRKASDLMDSLRKANE